MSFGRKMRRRNKAPLGTVWVKTDDAMMLAAGKQFLEQQDSNVFEMADEQVLVVIDTRDAIGALWACIHTGRLDEAGDDDARGRQIVADFVETTTRAPDGKPNPHPYVAFWQPRTTGLLDWLKEEGFGVPADWYPAFEAAPQHGNVWTLLKRNSAGILMSVDYSQIESLGAGAVKLEG